MLTYNLHLVVLQDAWRYNAAGVAYCYEQEPLSVYDPDSFQWIALVDILNVVIWERAARICYGNPVGQELALQRLGGDDAIPRVVLRYDAYSKRYWVYPQGHGEVTRAKRSLREALKWARVVALQLTYATQENNEFWDGDQDDAR